MIDLLGMFIGRNPFICKMKKDEVNRNNRWYSWTFKDIPVTIEFYFDSLVEDFRAIKHWLTEKDIDDMIENGEDLPDEFVTIIPAEFTIKSWNEIDTRFDELKILHPKKEDEDEKHYNRRIQNTLEKELKAINFIYKTRGIEHALYNLKFDPLHCNLRCTGALYLSPMNIAHRYTAKHLLNIANTH